LNERKAAWITCKLGRALNYLHQHHVCHRDLKPENVLFSKDGTLKIIDFGLAHYVKLPLAFHLMRSCCGTPHYVAPEVLGTDEYSCEVDFWSLGVILYIMLSGRQPFYPKSTPEIYDMITRGQYRFPKKQWDHVSTDAILCVKGLMHMDPKQRLNCDTLCKHPFIVKNVDLKKMEREEEEELLRGQEMMMQNSCLLLPREDLGVGNSVYHGDNDSAEKNDSTIKDQVKNYLPPKRAMKVKTQSMKLPELKSNDVVMADNNATYPLDS